MTIAIMLVVVMSSVILNIQPLTAIMIVGLALLGDIPIMTIAYAPLITALTLGRNNLVSRRGAGYGKCEKAAG